MKVEDFERLKAVCEKEGFDVLNLTHDDNEKYVLVKKAKDEWEGVEFAESLINGLIVNLPLNKSSSHLFKPSTEQAYVDQLKAKAFELYGEIKEGDRFTDWNGDEFCIDTLGFQYRKKYDALRFGDWIIYSEGKWAKKIEKVTVEWVTTSCDTIRFNYGNAKDVDLVKSGPELAKLIEEYLNK
jgi:hypothetical protein